MRDCQPFRGFALISTLKQPAQMLRDPSLACLFVCLFLQGFGGRSLEQLA